MNEEKKSPEIVARGPFVRWLDNYWYHYKWHTIGIAAVLIVFLVGTLSMCSREEEDLTMVYAGPTVLSVSEMEDITAVMGALMPYDADENGDKHTAWMTYEIYSKEQLLENSDINRSFNTEQYQTYGDYLLTGESSIYFLDPWLFEELKNADRLMPMKDVLKDRDIEGYGIRLGDTDLYEAYEVMRLMPADTVICLMRPYEGTPWAKSANEEAYQFECDMFRALVTFVNEDESAE